MVRQEFIEVDGNQMEMLVAEPEGDGPTPSRRCLVGAGWVVRGGGTVGANV